MTQTKHFSRYTETMDNSIHVKELESMEHLKFQEMITLPVLHTLTVKRNGMNGNQYRIIDLFDNDLTLYTLIFNGLVIQNNNKIRINFSQPQKYNVKMWNWLFPKGFPQTENQLKSWISYIGWVAFNRFK